MDALIRKFLDIFDRDQDWSRSRRFARRAGVMVFLHPRQEEDWVTGVKWDPDVFVRQPAHEGNGTTPIAWRRDFVEKVVALGCVPNLEEMPEA